jgi:hypothetical protein
LQGSNCRGGQVIPWDFPGMHRIRGRSLEYPYKRSKCHEREKSIHGVFNTGTRGFAAPEDSTTAVCILPRTELAFSEEVKCVPFRLGWKTKTINFRTAIFRQINKDVPRVHHHALEFPDPMTRVVSRSKLAPSRN